MKFSPGEWSERLHEGFATGAVEPEHSLGTVGTEAAASVMEAAQEWVSRFTVVIGTSEEVRLSKRAQDIAPGSGVLVKFGDDLFGVLTAAHVLNRGNNSCKSAEVALLAQPWDRTSQGEVMALNLRSRPCTTQGFNNTSEAGPDIAIIPLASHEWNVLEAWGMVAYNLDRERWSDTDKAQIGKMNPWVLSIINGVRCEASEILYSHTDGKTGSLATMATNTRIEAAEERDGYDYLELPAEVTEYSRPTHWRHDPPGTAAQEIEQLLEEGVTRRVWAGTSGAGVWNLVIGANESALPDGSVLAELAGICFFAHAGKGRIIAHGTKSIAKIVASHLEEAVAPRQTSAQLRCSL